MQETVMTTQAAVVLVIAIVAIAIVAWLLIRQRSTKLRSQFGPEYDRLVRERGSTFKAEHELEGRAKRVERLHIRHLSAEEAEDFAAEWRAVQERFVDDPRGAVGDADQLVQRAMKARGYPVGGDFDAQAADLSVDHPHVISNYRAAHAIAARDAQNQVSTEDLRLAMQHY